MDRSLVADAMLTGRTLLAHASAASLAVEAGEFELAADHLQAAAALRPSNLDLKDGLGLTPRERALAVLPELKPTLDEEHQAAFLRVFPGAETLTCPDRESSMNHTIRSTEDLGALIRRERKAQGLRQPDLAAAAGTSIRFIVEIEGGTSGNWCRPTPAVSSLATPPSGSSGRVRRGGHADTGQRRRARWRSGGHAGEAAAS